MGGPAPSFSTPWRPTPTQRGCRHPPSSASHASTSHRAGPTTSSPASASTAPASRPACARSESASPSSPVPTERTARAAALRRSGAALPHEVVHRAVRLDRLPCVTPEAILHVVRHLALPDEVVVHVGDLQLAAAG